jgi:hypothetical protein
VLDQSPLVANFLQGLGNDVNFIVNQKAMNVSIYLLMGFIQGGRYLFKWSMNCKERSGKILQNVKKAHQRMPNIVLGFSKPNLKLLQIPINNGIDRW